MKPGPGFWRVLLLLSLFAVAAAAHAQLELRPVDEAARQPDFFTFRAHLQAAIARRDVEAVLAIVHKGIRNTFGDNSGIEEFRTMWKPTEAGSKLWGELGAVLALGGTFDAQGRFIAPYVFSRWPGQADAFEHVAIIGENVRVRAAPRSDSQTLASLSFAIVPVVHPSPKSPAVDPSWTAIQLKDGRTGYVFSRFARSPIDYRAIFARVENRWQLVTFIAGD